MPSLPPDAVAVYPFRRLEGRLELLQLRRTDVGAGTWHNVYGGVEPGETAVEAALRELLEETGLPALALHQVEHLESFYFRLTDRVVLMPVFLVEVDPGASVRLDEEHDAHRWVPAEEADRWFMWRSQREALRVGLEGLSTGGPAAERLRVPLSGGEGLPLLAQGHQEGREGGPQEGVPGPGHPQPEVAPEVDEGDRRQDGRGG